MNLRFKIVESKGKGFDYILYDNATGKIYECRKNEVNEIIWSLLGVQKGNL